MGIIFGRICSMKISEQIIALLPQKENLVVSVTGSGGKTSLINVLAQELRKRGKTVLITTTTKFQSPMFYKWNADAECSNEADIFSIDLSQPKTVVFAKESFDVKKWQCPDMKIMEVLTKKFDVTLIEADGSRQLPLKLHTDRDPVVPAFSDFTLVMVGAWGACDIASNQTCGCDSEEEIDSAFINTLISGKDGMLKNTEYSKRAVIVNNGEQSTEEQLEVFRHAIWPEDCMIMEGSVQKDELERRY